MFMGFSMPMGFRAAAAASPAAVVATAVTAAAAAVAVMAVASPFPSFCPDDGCGGGGMIS